MNEKRHRKRERSPKCLPTLKQDTIDEVEKLSTLRGRVASQSKSGPCGIVRYFVKDDAELPKLTPDFAYSHLTRLLHVMSYICESAMVCECEEHCNGAMTLDLDHHPDSFVFVSDADKDSRSVGKYSSPSAIRMSMAVASSKTLVHVIIAKYVVETLFCRFCTRECNKAGKTRVQFVEQINAYGDVLDQGKGFITANDLLPGNITKDLCQVIADHSQCKDACDIVTFFLDVVFRKRVSPITGKTAKYGLVDEVRTKTESLITTLFQIVEGAWLFAAHKIDLTKKVFWNLTFRINRGQQIAIPCEKHRNMRDGASLCKNCDRSFPDAWALAVKNHRIAIENAENTTSRRTTDALSAAKQSLEEYFPEKGKLLFDMTVNAVYHSCTVFFTCDRCQIQLTDINHHVVNCKKTSDLTFTLRKKVSAEIPINVQELAVKNFDFDGVKQNDITGRINELLLAFPEVTETSIRKTLSMIRKAGARGDEVFARIYIDNLPRHLRPCVLSLGLVRDPTTPDGEAVFANEAVSVNDRIPENRSREWFAQRLGGKCSVFGCGVTDLKCLDFNHADPSKKEYPSEQIAIIFTRCSWDRILRMVRNMELLCKPHHMLETHLQRMRGQLRAKERMWNKDAVTEEKDHVTSEVTE
jgi:hypothetical protein